MKARLRKLEQRVEQATACPVCGGPRTPGEMEHLSDKALDDFLVAETARIGAADPVFRQRVATALGVGAEWDLSRLSDDELSTLHLLSVKATNDEGEPCDRS